jgi:hypothetical protein
MQQLHIVLTPYQILTFTLPYKSPNPASSLLNHPWAEHFTIRSLGQAKPHSSPTQTTLHVASQVPDQKELFPTSVLLAIP